jgi:hypothetical protein
LLEDECSDFSSRGPVLPSQEGDALIRQFVEKFKELSDLSFFPQIDPIATTLSVGKVEAYGEMETWLPVRATTAQTALDSINAKLPARFPKLFRDLLLNYRWGEVDLGFFRLSPNPPGPDLAGWLAEVSRDRFLWDFLIAAACIPFAKGPDIDNDRVCFDIRSRKKGWECPVVKVDHEEVLCNNRLKIVKEVAPTFRDLVLQTIDPKRG